MKRESKMEMEQAYHKIKSIVYQCLQPGFGLDRDDLVTGLWLELFKKSGDDDMIVSSKIVKGRCMSALRKLHRKREESLNVIPCGILDSFSQPGDQDILDQREYEEGIKEKLNLVMRYASITQDEASIIHLHYYKKWSLASIAHEKGTSRKAIERLLRATLRKIQQSAYGEGMVS